MSRTLDLSDRDLYTENIEWVVDWTGTKKPDPQISITPYSSYMEYMLAETSGIFWIIVIPLGSIIWIYQSYKLRNHKVNHPEEYI